MVEKSTGRKTIESYIKHEDLVDNAVQLGKSNGLDVRPTVGNDPRGDVEVALEDIEIFLRLLSETIDRNKDKRSASSG